MSFGAELRMKQINLTATGSSIDNLDLRKVSVKAGLRERKGRQCNLGKRPSRQRSGDDPSMGGRRDTHDSRLTNRQKQT